MSNDTMYLMGNSMNNITASVETINDNDTNNG